MPGEIKILTAVAQHPGGVTREQLSVLTGYKRSSRDTYLLRLKAADGDPLFLRVMAEQRWDVIPGAESREVFGGRLRRAIERIADAHPGGRVIVFSHGAAIGEILAQASDSGPFAFINADNTSISRLVVTPERWIVRGYNDTAHLAG